MLNQSQHSLQPQLTKFQRRKRNALRCRFDHKLHTSVFETDVRKSFTNRGNCSITPGLQTESPVQQIIRSSTRIPGRLRSALACRMHESRGFWQSRILGRPRRLLSTGSHYGTRKHTSHPQHSNTAHPSSSSQNHATSKYAAVKTTQQGQFRAKNADLKKRRFSRRGCCPPPQPVVSRSKKSPSFTVGRSGRPLYIHVSSRWFSPSRCSIDACRSCTCRRSSTARSPSSSVRPIV